MSLSNLSKQHNKYTILQVLPSLGSGGVERGTIEVAKQLKKLGHKPIVISSGGSLVMELIEANILHIFMNSASKNLFTIWRNARRISAIIKEYNVDLVHARSRAPAWSCYMATKATNTKFITTFHGIYDISNVFKKYYNSVMIKGEKVIAVSNFVKQHLLKHYQITEDKILVVHRGVDYNYFDPSIITTTKLLQCKEKYDIPTNVPIILLAARMTSWKGHMTVVEALSKLTHRNFYCLMIGDLSEHPHFIKRVKDFIVALKLQSRIQIFGKETDMPTLYKIADIILSTSIRPEAFGRTIIEGQSMEKLVIATNIGGAVETIRDQETGYHIKSNDTNDLLQKIDHCLSILGTEEAKRIQSAARKTVIDNFPLDLMLRRIIEIYINCLSND